MKSQLRGGVSRTVDISGPVHVVDYGGAGSPLVLVHGLGGSHLNWMLVGPSLAARHRVIAVDLPGFGLTAPEGRSARLGEQAEIVAELIRTEFGEPATIVGNSMGGLVAMLVADRAPDVAGRLVLVAPALLPTEIDVPTRDSLRYLILPSLPTVGELWVKVLRDRRTPEEQIEARMQYVAADPDRIPDEVRVAGVAMEEARRRMPWSATAFAEAGRSIAAVLMRRRRVLDMIHGIGAPVLVVHGEVDPLVPVAEAIRLHALRPDWEVVTLEGVGHVPQLEVAEHFTKLLLDWLERTSGYEPVIVRD